jgi:hypothetical protein
MIKRVNMKQELFVKLGILFLLVILLSSSVSAWARHGQMTQEVVKDLGWLDRFANITVTEYVYEDPTVNQIRIRYYNLEQGELGPEDFFYHALYEDVLFFEGAKLAEQTSAAQVLVDFVDEPDWELDQELDLSWMQAFHGESQGYRHMYYPTWTFHVPMGAYPQGETPERVAHFYSMAKNAFADGDAYWGFRFLARAMHYVQDMAQPYHTRQLYSRFISLKDPYHGTIQVIKNYHFAYESYQANLFRLEQQDVMPKRLVSALRYSLPVEVGSPESLVKYVARRSHWKSSRTMKSSIDFLGEKYLEPEGVVMIGDEFFGLIDDTDDASKMFHDDLEKRMVLVGKGTKSFLEFARKDLNLDEYELD